MTVLCHRNVKAKGTLQRERSSPRILDIAHFEVNLTKRLQISTMFLTTSSAARGVIFVIMTLNFFVTCDVSHLDARGRGSVQEKALQLDDSLYTTRQLREKRLMQRLFPEPDQTEEYPLHTAQVVRVSMNDFDETFEPDISPEKLEELSFGMGRGVVSTASILNGCSYGKFRFGEFQVTTERTYRKPIIEKVPVTNIKIEAEVQDFYKGLISESDLFELAKKEFVLLHTNYTSLPEFVFMVFPVLIDKPVYEDERYSFFDSDYITDVGNMVRAVGHQIGLTESGEGNFTDADVTGHMGWRMEDEVPSKEKVVNKKCFNAVKSWQLGWYSDRHKTVRPRRMGQKYEVELVPVAQYSEIKPDDEEASVIVKIPNLNSLGDLFIFFNSKRGINAGTNQFLNMVGIYRGGSNSTSYALAGLNVGESYTVENFNNDGTVLTITCSSLFINYFLALPLTDLAKILVSVSIN
mmetsp:Transcript_32874/g.38059  ORF Transcript_32874/g.38059 Transcript_32874/m.38059 type:complete len:465 (-) Transcript_32874:74-1468(-)